MIIYISEDLKKNKNQKKNFKVYYSKVKNEHEQESDTLNIKFNYFLFEKTLFFTNLNNLSENNFISKEGGRWRWENNIFKTKIYTRVYAVYGQKNRVNKKG